MADATAPTAPRRSRVPQWLYEGVDLVQQRRRALLITFGVLVVIAAIVAYAAPEVLPPTPLVGAAIGLAALLLALALLIALDTADIRLRGPRHVRAAGGELVAVLPSEPSPEGAVDLARAIEEARPSGRTLLLGIAAATGDGKRVGRWAQVVARTLADRDISVLSLDLTAEGSNRPGFLEVVRHGHKLGQVVELDPELRLATLGPGRDATEALQAFNEAGRWIPRDLEVLIVALPMAASRAVVRASLSLDQLLIVAERDRTSRVELIAGLDATEAVGTHSQVILIDDTYARYLGIGAAPAEDVPPEEDALPVETGATEDETADESVPEPHPDPIPDPMPEPIPDPEPEPAPQPEPPPQPDPHPGPTPEPGPLPTPEPEPQPTPEPEPEPVAASDSFMDDDGDRDEGDHDQAEEAGPRDLDVVIGAAAATALADIAAHDDVSHPGGGPSGDQPDGDEPPDEPVTDESRGDADDGEGAGLEVEELSEAPPEAQPDDADRNELTVQVHRPQSLDDEPTLEVERRDDAPPTAGPEPTEPAETAEGAQSGERVPANDPSVGAQVEAEAEGEDDADLLTNTARLSLLMDEVGDRSSDASRGGA